MKRLAVGLSILMVAAISGLLSAETGMCLVVCKNTRERGIQHDFFWGDIRRIDMKNGVVVHTTGPIGYGLFPRFSPDGKKSSLSIRGR